MCFVCFSEKQQLFPHTVLSTVVLSNGHKVCVFLHGNNLVFKYLDQYFPKRAAPPLGGRWNYLGER
jgi:hypothetical protein